MERMMSDDGREVQSFVEDDDEFYTITEITEALRQHLESEFPDVKVLGEIANFKFHTSGHLYFSLRDESNQLKAVMFRRNAANLDFSPVDGMLVVASGRISHYGGSGQTQLLTNEMAPAGRGAMELEFRRLLQRLMDEGLTAPERKRPLEPYPTKIIVITSPTGAVIKDITDTIGRRWPVAELIHICVPVQGDGAAQAIIGAFDLANRIPDASAVILARGGGSAEDLWTFNREDIARAIVDSVHPVITGIGHEIDTTIADYVSDVRAATPTAAAEVVAPHIEEVTRILEEQTRRLGKLFMESQRERLRLLEFLLRSAAFPALIHRIESSELKLDDRLGRLQGWWERGREGIEKRISALEVEAERAVGTKLHSLQSGLGRISESLVARNPEGRIPVGRERTGRLSRMLEVNLKHALAVRKGELDGIARTLDGLYPMKVLKRGYTYCSSPDGSTIIARADATDPGDNILVNFFDGGAHCRVERKRKGRSWPRK